jgi:hypothetical protein
MSERDVWLSIQPFVGEEDTIQRPKPDKFYPGYCENTQRLPIGKAYKLKTAFGSDLLFSAQKTVRQGVMLTYLTIMKVRKRYKDAIHS